MSGLRGAGAIGSPVLRVALVAAMLSLVMGVGQAQDRGGLRTSGGVRLHSGGGTRTPSGGGGFVRGGGSGRSDGGSWRGGARGWSGAGPSYSGGALRTDRGVRLYQDGGLRTDRGVRLYQDGGRPRGGLRTEGGVRLYPRHRGGSSYGYPRYGGHWPRHYGYYYPRSYWSFGFGWGAPYYHDPYYYPRPVRRVYVEPYESEVVVEVTNLPPDGCYYYDRYCDRTFDDLDGYTEHVMRADHPRRIQVIEEESGRRLRTLVFDDGYWVVLR